jgi:hypothetical protein
VENAYSRDIGISRLSESAKGVSSSFRVVVLTRADLLCPPKTQFSRKSLFLCFLLPLAEVSSSSPVIC